MNSRQDQEREAIRLRQAQLAADKASCTELAGLKEALQTTAGVGVTEAVQRVEPLLAEIAHIAEAQQTFLTTVRRKTMLDYMVHLPVSPARTACAKLLGELQARERELRRELASVQELFNRSKQFIDFHVNVLTATAASSTYGPPGTDPGEQRGIKMFEADV